MDATLPPCTGRCPEKTEGVKKADFRTFALSICVCHPRSLCLLDKFQKIRYILETNTN